MDDPRTPATLPRRPRNRDALPELDFERLRVDGIAHLQRLSGELWTDYNLHDPGVTLLELLSFALTDLSYRAGFPVADHLAGADGSIDLDALALHGPAQAYPCRPTNLLDLRKTLIDAVDGLDDALIDDTEVPGLLRLTGRLGASLTKNRIGGPDHGVEEALFDTWSSVRNLCEDLVTAPALTRECPCRLEAVVEIDGSRDPVEVLAEIHLACGRMLTGRVDVTHYAERAARMDAAEVFSGPLLRHGYLEDRRLASRAAPGLDDPGLSASVGAVPGVERVRRIALRPSREADRDAQDDGGVVRYWRLELPDGEDTGVVLVHGNRRVDVDGDALVRELERSAFRERNFLRQERDYERVIPAPRGTPRALATSLPLEESLPGIYATSVGSLPAGADAGLRTSSLQLRGYLLIFEQLLADLAADTDALRELYTPAPGAVRTRWLGRVPAADRAIADGLLTEDFGDRAEAINRAHDDAEDRKGRLLDSLLALHGEVGGGYGLERFDVYGEAENASEALRNRQRFCAHLIAAGRDRGAGFDYRRPYWDSDNVSGLQLRVALELGFEAPFARRLTDFPADAPEDAEPDRDPDAPDDAALYGWLLQRVLRATAPAGAIDERVLRAAIRRDVYRVTPDADGAVTLEFVLPSGAGRWPIGTFPDESDAHGASSALRRDAVALNRAGEGMHLVEDLLLRPRGEPEGAPLYCNRVTAVLPAWSARCHDRAFRAFAEEVVRRNCPAHVGVTILWADFADLRRFERLLDDWLCALRRHDPDDDALDAPARALGDWLRSQAPSARAPQA